MKRFVLLVYFSFIVGLTGYCQGAQTYFNTSANFYVNNKRSDAMRSLQEGIKKYPNDSKLRALADKLKEEEKQKEDQQKKDQENKDQEKKEKDKKDQEKKDQQNKDQQNKDQQDQAKKDKEEKEAKDKKEGKEQDQRENKEDKNEKKENSPQLSEKLQQMKISEDKAKMILEAMKNQEIQYLQQNKRKATKPRDSSKPDW